MEHPTWIGRTLSGRYKIEAILGQGGMSAVYKATDPNLKRVVAIKLVHPHLSTEPTFVLRFESEASAVASLRHQNIVQVYDFNNDGGVYYMVLEFIPGETLQDRLKRLREAGRVLPVEEALKFTLNIADAMGYAHERGMVHRDIKPANIMLDVQGQAILMDFGIVKILGGDSHTSTGAVVGTARYMSPESIRGEVADHRADIYSLGVTLYEMVSGRPPFVADSAMTLMMMHLNDPIPDVRDFRADVDPRLVAILEKCLAKNRIDRYQFASELAADLRRALTYVGEQSTAINTPTASRLQSGTTKSGSQPVAVSPTALHHSQDALPELKKVTPVFNLRLLGLFFGVLVTIICLGFAGKTIINNLPSFGPSPTLFVTPQPTVTNTSAPTQTPIPPTPTLGVGSTMVSDKDGMTLMYVPAGEFTMGSDSGSNDEKPIHTVNVDAFWIDQTEVTNTMFAEFMDETGYATDAEKAGKSLVFQEAKWRQIDGADWLQPFGPSSGISDIMDHPVVHVSWNDAQSYCSWAGRRLPTETEWEKAARGTDENVYPWGDTFDGSLANFCDTNCTFDWKDDSFDDGFAYTAPVRNYPDGASPFGALNLAGNVWEWVADWYDAYPGNSVSAPEYGTSFHVLRGGAWTDGFNVSSTSRRRGTPTDSNNYVGFRCSRGTSP